MQPARSANDFIESQLDARLQGIEERFEADAISFSGPIMLGADDVIRHATESRRSKKSGRDKLIFLLTTSGGYIEVVQRMVATLRHHYTTVDFIIPNYAFSAGTVLAMSGDAIFMDYYSRLGPIDPQVESKSGRSVSALGYLEQYEALIKKAAAGKLNVAEVQILLDFDQGDLYNFQQARELSISLLKEWLVQYKFKNWRVTQQKKRQVTEKMKTDRAALIARELNKTTRWHTHGHGISKEVLEKHLNLRIDDFTDHPALGTGLSIREYHELLTDYMSKTGANGAYHVVGEYGKFM